MHDIYNCYNIGSVLPYNSAHTGSVLGKSYNSTIISNCFYKIGTHNNNSGYGTSKTEVEMKSQAMADLLNGTQNPKVWGYNPELNGGYPYIGKMYW